MRTRTRLAAALAGFAALTALTGCGADETTTQPGSGGTADVTTSPDASASTTDLTIVVNDGAGKTTTWKLSCDPPGGDHPDAAAACAVLERNGETALPPVPEDQMCTQIYGGPETATITGSWKGAEVSSKLSKANGCEMGRWRALAGLLPAANV